ncbi:MAG: hypothetical protein ACD_20C00174G0010 [uncultured bacterium]|nr:MAG: hypothetical protein ACD_20C00174G0010 [uncultured bacterium]
MHTPDKINEIDAKVNHMERMLLDLDNKIDEIKNLIVEHQSHAKHEEHAQGEEHQ